MSAPICGARTWVEPEVMVECVREDGHTDMHRDGGYAAWRTEACRFVIGSDEHALSSDAARALVASLQSQLDALDPDAAIAEAKKKAHDAYLRCSVLRAQAKDARSSAHVEALVAETNAAFRDWEVDIDTWLALVEARDARGGGV